jgi:hypothetical protein
VKKDEVDESQSIYSKEKLNAVFGKIFAFSKPNIIYIIVGSISAFANGLIWPIFNIAFSNIMALMVDAQKNSDDIDKYCLLFLAVAIGGGLCTFLYTFSFGIVG